MPRIECCTFCTAHPKFVSCTNSELYGFTGAFLSQQQWKGRWVWLRSTVHHHHSPHTASKNYQLTHARVCSHSLSVSSTCLLLTQTTYKITSNLLQSPSVDIHQQQCSLVVDPLGTKNAHSELAPWYTHHSSQDKAKFFNSKGHQQILSINTAQAVLHRQ